MPTRRRINRVRAIYTFIKAHRREFRIKTMCRVLGVTRAGYYQWLRNPLCDRAKEDLRLLTLIRSSYEASHGVYGAPRILLDLREMGETCSKHRVARLMRVNKIRASHGYRAPRYITPKVSSLVPNLLQREFNMTKPDRAWVTDITYVRTWEGWLYLAVVMDLFSRKIIGWSMQSTISRNVILEAIKMAVRLRRPRKALIHSDQGSQYGSDAWRRFCRAHKLEPSMSRRGNCWDNAVIESFFGSLKKERIKKRIYATREQAKADVTDYIQNFYNRIRRHGHLNGQSPEVFEAQFRSLSRCP